MPNLILDGILNLNKSSGPTSMDMVRIVKRLTQVKRVGHSGTLDPIATGVLPICFGQATRLMDYLINQPKAYQVQLRLGAMTDTHDSTGTVTQEADYSDVTRAQIEALFPLFTGVIQQQPPMYSALKREGKRLYDLARAGVEVERPTREVQVYGLSLLEWDPPMAIMRAECGRGLYIRTLIHDMGVALGCGAHLSALVRLRVGPFNLEEATTPEEFESTVALGKWQDLLCAPDAALLDHDTVVVEPAAERQLRNGQPIPLRFPGLHAQHMELRRAYTSNDRFIGLVRFNRAQNVWQPEKVFSFHEPSPHSPTRTVA